MSRIAPRVPRSPAFGKVGLAGIMGILVLLLHSPLALAAERPPNVVLVITDDKYLESAAAKQQCRIFGIFSAKILVCELAPIEANSGRLT